MAPSTCTERQHDECVCQTKFSQFSCPSFCCVI